MTEQNIKQSWFEFECWKRSLDFIQTENIFLKNRLAIITKEQTSNTLLNDIELFQAKLIGGEHSIVLLKSDIGSLETWLKREIIGGAADFREVMKSQKKLRKEIESAEHVFNKLKLEFNSFFSERLLD